MAYKTKKGIILRNPAEKGRRFAKQLKNNKVTETNKKLTKNERSYRIGYLNARRDNAKAYVYNRNKRRKRG